MSFEIKGFQTRILITGGFFLGSGAADSKKKGSGPAGPAGCFFENAVSEKTIWIYLRCRRRKLCRGLFAAETAKFYI